VHAVPGGAGNSPQPIREYLRGLNARFRLQGVMLIGDLPIAWYAQRHASADLLYTSDYYFMELEGNWSVGPLNVVSGASKPPPTVAAGRVFIASGTGIIATRPPVTELYNRFLGKAVAYRRQGESYRQGRKTAVVSNLSYANVYAGHLRNLFPAPLPMDQQDGATVAQYRTFVESPYDWLLYYGHSDSGQHQMAGGGSWNPFHYLESAVKVNTFQFESCAVGSFAWRTTADPSDPSSPAVVKAMSDAFVSNILGNTGRGLTVFAPSIPGFFDDMVRFFNFLAGGGTYGDAFRRWMAAEIQENDPHYMMHFGDPFLSFRTVPPSKYAASFWDRIQDLLRRRGIYYE